MKDPATGGQRHRRYRTFLNGCERWEKRKGYECKLGVRLYIVYVVVQKIKNGYLL